MLIWAFLWGNDLKAFPLLKSAIFAFPHECHLKPTTTTTTWNSKQKLKSAIFCFFYQSFFIKAPLFFLLFTLHQIGWNPDKHWGCERWRVTYHSSPLFTFGLRTELKRKLALFGWGAETTFLCPTDFIDLHRFFGKRLRVKSGEE